MVKNPPANVGNARDTGLIPGLGRSPGEGNDNPLQYFCLENPVDGGAWWAIVHGIAKSQTRLSDFTFTFHFSLPCIGEGNGNPLQCSCLENPHGQRSLAGYRPWGHKELDMTEQLHFDEWKFLIVEFMNFFFHGFSCVLFKASLLNG